MLRDLKPIDREPQLPGVNSRVWELRSLRSWLHWGGPVEFDYHGRQLTLCGTDERFQIYLDGNLVSRFVGGVFLDVNETLVRELVE